MVPEAHDLEKSNLKQGYRKLTKRYVGSSWHSYGEAGTHPGVGLLSNAAGVESLVHHVRLEWSAVSALSRSGSSSVGLSPLGIE